MAPQQRTADEQQLRLFEYLDGNGFANRRLNFEIFTTTHSQLSSEDTVSPRIFRMIFDQHLGPVIEVRTYIMKELSNIWGMYHVLGTETGHEEKKDNLKRASEAAVSARNKLEGLLGDIVDIVTTCVERVNWRKHIRNNYQEELRKWLMQKQMHFIGLIGESNNSLIKADLQNALLCLTQGTTALATPQSTIKAKTSGGSTIIKIKTNKSGTNTPNFDFPEIRLPNITIPKVKNKVSDIRMPGLGNSPFKTLDIVPTSPNTSNKRPPTEFDAFDDDNSPPPTKKQRQGNILIGVWWGPNKSKLSCGDSFFDVIREFRAYIANPPHAPGTHDYSVQMIKFLKRALAEVNMSHRYNDLLLKDEWNFRDKRLGNVRGPTMIHAGAPESRIRLGAEGFRGLNELKTDLGGGLTEFEKDWRDHAPEAQGMLALAHSYSINNRVGLRGGDASHDAAETPAKSARGVANLQLRDPAVLWAQLLEDASYPEGVFQEFVQEERPPMIDPERVGNPLKVHRSEMEKVPDPAEWQKIQNETRLAVMNDMLEDYAMIIATAKEKIDQFLHHNEHIIPDQPKLNEEGGRDRPKRRYKGNFRDRDFGKPIGHAFQARMYQIFRLALVWKLYSQGQGTLKQLLEEERAVLETWDEHEELYMEWENLRWFVLSRRYEVADLENRYQAREFLRKIWEIEREGFDEVLEDLENNPDNYANLGRLFPGVRFPIQRIHRASTSPSPAFPVPHPTPFDKPGGLAPPGATVQHTTLMINPFADVVGIPGDPTPLEKALEGAPDSDDPEALKFWANLDMLTLIKASNMPTGPHVQNPYTVSNEATNDSNKPKGKNIIVDARNETPTHISLKFLEKRVAVYETELHETIRENDKLDNMDPGNAAVIQRNNIDIMAKQQLIWSFHTEIHNLRRSLDPLSEDGYGLGAEHNRSMLRNSYYWRYTTPLPKKSVPLGVTSPRVKHMPGEHPAPESPYALPDYSPDPSEDADIDGENVDPTAGGLSGVGGNPNNQIPKDWPGFIALHKESWSGNEPSGTALLDWDDWTEAVYQALRNSTRSLRRDFPNGSPYKFDNPLRHRVRDVYERSVESRQSPDSMTWRKREKQRSAILETFAAEVNAALAATGQPKSFPRVEALPPVSTESDVSTDKGEAATPEEPGAQMDKAIHYLRNIDEAKLTINKLNRIRSSGIWTLTMAASLEKADYALEHYKAAYETAKNEADEATSAQLAAMEKIMEAQLRDEIRVSEKAIDRRVTRGKARAARAAKNARTTNSPAKLQDITEMFVAEEEADAAATEPTLYQEPTTELEKAEQTWEELNAICQASAHIARKARRNLAVAKEAAASAQDNDEYLNRAVAYAQEQETKLLAESDEAWIRARIASEAVEAQRQFDDTPEDADELLERYEAVTQDFAGWVDLYDWDELAATPKHTHDQWVIDVTWLMHEAYKAVLGMNVGAAYWPAMYENFWATQGASFARKREIWVYVLMQELNGQIAQAGREKGQGEGEGEEKEKFEPFVETPQQPPAEWLYDTPAKEELIAQEEAAMEAGGAIAALSTVAHSSTASLPRSKALAFLAPPKVPGARPMTPPMPLLFTPRTPPGLMKVIKPKRGSKSESKKHTPWSGGISPVHPGLAQPIIDLQPHGALATEEEEEEYNPGSPLVGGLFGSTEGSDSDIEDASTGDLASSVSATSEDEPMPMDIDDAATDASTPRSDDPSSYDGSDDPSPYNGSDDSGSYDASGDDGSDDGSDAGSSDEDDAWSPTPTMAPAELLEDDGTCMNDAWPDLKDVIMAAWNARIAREVLQQKEGDTTGVPPGRGEGWPRPVRAREHGRDYMCL
ncbi:hypothetical protein F5Y09DRAFT_225902 [Xylaria sp. FL1042]|nr:hypothetical protein F5Y09DRAFT_225902 [Xylaria sp. FL1042]